MLHDVEGWLVVGAVLFQVLLSLCFGIVVHGINHGLMSYWTASSTESGSELEDAPGERELGPSKDTVPEDADYTSRNGEFDGEDSDNDSLEVVDII